MSGGVTQVLWFWLGEGVVELQYLGHLVVVRWMSLAGRVGGELTLGVRRVGVGGVGDLGFGGQRCVEVARKGQGNLAKILPQVLWASSPQALHGGCVGSVGPVASREGRASSLNSPRRTLAPRSAGDRGERCVLLGPSGGEHFSTRQPTRRSRGAPVGVSHSPQSGRLLGDEGSRSSANP